VVDGGNDGKGEDDGPENDLTVFWIEEEKKTHEKARDVG